MAKRYVDADWLKQCSYVMEYKDEWHMTKYGEFVELADIENAPTADVVEVVRCKDCKHSIEDKLFGGLWCQHPTEKHCERNADFYCWSGEREDDGKIH